MPIDAIAGAGGAAPFSAQPKPPSSTDDRLGTETFLQLMVAQLKYQNPLSPSDGTEFLAQTAQFTMVEKLNQLASQSNELLETNRSLTAAALIGQTVSWAEPDGQIISGEVTGARFGSEGPTLLVGPLAVPLAAVREVS
jgi:flagellar basal-body rod modification protein FlgD